MAFNFFNTQIAKNIIFVDHELVLNIIYKNNVWHNNRPPALHAAPYLHTYKTKLFGCHLRSATKLTDHIMVLKDVKE